MKYALLDTDFISKAYCIMDNDGNRLIDRKPALGIFTP